MLLALGVGSQIGTLEGVISTVFDIQIVRGARKEVVSGRKNKRPQRRYTLTQCSLVYDEKECLTSSTNDVSPPLFSMISLRLHHQLPDRTAVRDGIGRVLGQDL